MNKKKKISLVIIGILLVALIAVGTSYAYWKLTVRQESTNRYTSASCFNVSFDLDEDTPISLPNAYPMSNEDGMKLEPYTFTIENTCEAVVNYSVQLNILEESTLDSKYVKYSMTSKDIDIVGLQKQVEAKINNATAYEIKTGTLLKGQKKDFAIRLWLDQNTPQSEGMRKIFTSKIVVETNAAKLSEYADASGAEKPVLNNGMIPVVWNGREWVKANTSEKWYDYDEQWWANAVTVSSATRDSYTSEEVNTPINMNDIETMWVWVPRYEYQHTNLGTQYAGGTRYLPRRIEINFISKEIITPSSDNFTIHDAFWWDDNNDGVKDTSEQLSGIWVAKFEMSTGETTCTASDFSVETGCDFATINPQIKPNIPSWRGARIGTFWTAIHNNMNGENNIYGLTNSDAHLMKNMEWGAVAYLSQSKYGKYGNSAYEGANKEIYQNKSARYYTGRSNGTPSQNARNTQVTYDIEGTGTGASTTGNIYGIYDMSGGSDEYVMGIQAVEYSYPLEPMVGNTSADSGWSGKAYDNGNWTEYTGTYGPLKDIGSKYYDLYDYGTISTDSSRYHKGDATYETIGWYYDYAYFVYTGFSFFNRGSYQSSTTNAGVFSMEAMSGFALSWYSGRPVLVAQP